jgi:ATP-dependent Zn protease
VHHLVESAFLRAKGVLREREKVLRALAARLTEVETMEGAEMHKLIAEVEGRTEAEGQVEAGTVAVGG